MKILGNRVLVSRIEEPKKDGFETVDVQDSFVYKGKVEQIGTPMLPDGGLVISFAPAEKDEFRLYNVGDTIYFAKYSPDTQEVEHEGKKFKVVKVEDIIAVL